MRVVQYQPETGFSAYRILHGVGMAAATLSLVRTFALEALARRGTANDRPISARALLWIVAGHERHHAALLRERYGLGATA